MNSKLKPDNHNVLILIDSHQRSDFFKRFLSSMKALKLKPIIITALPSQHLKFKRLGVTSYLCHKTPTTLEISDNCLEYEAGILQKNLCEKIFSATYKTADFIFKSHSIYLCFMWNGSRLQSRALSKAAEIHGIDTIYMELSNIPGKLFIDHLGMNSESFLFKNPESLFSKSSDENEYLEWKEQYIISKFENNSVPQAKTSNKINFIYLLDYLLWLLGYGQNLFNLKHVVTSLLNLLSLKKVKVKYNLKLNTPFIFLPLQVNSDSQILFHSDIDNLKAIKQSILIAKREHCNLAVKIHPAENDSDFIKTVNSLRKEYNFSLTNDNTFKLIKDCKKVITINSSVGLESTIMEKQVTFLGCTIYKNINADNIHNFIISHLVDIDYFSNSEITTENILSIINHKKNNIKNN